MKQTFKNKPSKNEIVDVETKLLTALFVLYNGIEKTPYTIDMIQRIEKRLGELK